MDNNGKANTMETLKAKVLEFKERATPRSWTLVALSLVIAVPFSGGTLVLGSFVTAASPLALLLVLLGLVGYVCVIYGFIYNFLLRLERTFVVKPEIEIEEED
jgi:hypothetical protein